MPKFNQKGFANLFILLILLAGIIGGLYLVQNPTVFKSKATGGGIIPPNSVIVTNATISSDTVVADGTTQYTLTVTGIDGTGASDIGHMFAGIGNIPSNTNTRGVLTWYSTENTWWGPASENTTTPIDCAGGGKGASYTGGNGAFGSSYINLIRCSTTASGNTRESSFVVTFNPSFTTPISNKVSGVIGSISRQAPAWTEFGTFSLSQASPSSNWNYRRDYSGVQGQNNLYYLAYIKPQEPYSNATFDGTNWTFAGSNTSDRNFLIQGNGIAPSYPSNAVIRWRAPRSGNISINGFFKRCCSEPGDYNYTPHTIFSVRKNTTELWRRETNTPDRYEYALTSSVSPGDNIEFWVDANNDSGWDGTDMDFTISY